MQRFLYNTIPGASIFSSSRMALTVRDGLRNPLNSQYLAGFLLHSPARTVRMWPQWLALVR